MLLLYRNNHMESLLLELAAVLGEPKRRVLQPEVVVVQSLGMERWLSMGLAKQFGVWANATYPFPRAFIDTLADAVIGPQKDGERYAKEILTLHLAKILESLPEDPTLALLNEYLRHRSGVAARLELAQQLAEVFDQVQVYRPDWLLTWGGSIPAPPRTDTEHNRFLPALYRLLVARMGEQHAPVRLRELVRRLQQGDFELKALPERLSLFGVASLPPMFIQVFDALSRHLPVHWYLLTASREYIGEEGSGVLVGETGDPEDGSRGQQPLLRSYGRIMRDMGLLLERDCQYVESARIEFFESDPTSVLSTLQSDLCALRRRGRGADEPPLRLAEQDRSVEVHACHGPRRELEVLRELLLDAFERDPTLRPEDVIVLLRDVEIYAPLVEAVFSSEAHRPGYIPYTLSDRAVGSGNPLAEAMLRLLDLASSRMTILDVCELVEQVPIQRRFGISPAQAPKIREWMQRLHVTWGVDLADRLREGAVGQAENTLRFGLARLLLGVACGNRVRTPWHGLLPIGLELQGDDAELVGRLAECTELLFQWRTRFAESRSLSAWHQLIAEASRALLLVDAQAAWQLAELLAVTARLEQDAAAAEFDEAVPPNVIVARIRRHYEQTRSAQTLLSSGVTFCRMLPMRGIPARFVAMVGLDDGCFPRTETSSSFDEVSRAPNRPGDRSTRNEDRHLFLETILAARDRLIITYCGRNPRDDTLLPRSVVVEELLTVIDESFEYEPVRPSERLVIWHPLHAHDHRYFDGSDVRTSGRSWGEYQAALAQRGAHQAMDHGMTTALDAPACAEIALEDLERFWLGPAEYFYRFGLGASLERERPPLLPLDRTELDALERYLLTTDQLKLLLQQTSASEVIERWTAEGRRPYANLGTAIFDEQLALAVSMRDVVSRLIGSHTAQPSGAAVSIGSVRVVGLVLELFPVGIVDFGTSVVTAKHRLRLWLRHLLLNANGASIESWLIRRHKQNKRRIAVEKLDALAPTQAGKYLEKLVELYRLGQRIPLPFFPQLSFDYARRIRDGEEPEVALSRAQRDYGDPLNDDSDAFGKRPVGPREVMRLFGEDSPLTPGWATRFGVPGAVDFAEFAQTVFGPYLEGTQLIDSDELPTDVCTLSGKFVSTVAP